MDGFGVSKALQGLSAWLINLDRSAQRLAQMEERIAALGAPFEVRRFSAVDGKAHPELIAQVDQEAFISAIGRPILAGEIGVYFSHLRVWQQFLQSDAEVALVMEDDVVFHEDFLPALQVALENVARWDMLKLNKIRAKAPITQFSAAGYDFNAYLGVATGYGAYLITRDAAERLLTQLLPIRMPIDHATARYYDLDLRLLGMEPFPSHVDDGGASTITGQHFNAVQKPKPWMRLPSYFWRLRGDIGRLFWLKKNGMLKKRR